MVKLKSRLSTFLKWGLAISMTSSLYLVHLHRNAPNILSTKQSLTTNAPHFHPTKQRITRNLNGEAELTIHDNKAYICTDLRPDFILNDRNQAPPDSRCLGGLYSWQTCQNGYFLCEAENISVPSREPSVLKRCTDDTTVPFKFKCIENTCMVSGFRYDPKLTERFYQDTGIVLSCYARKGAGSSLSLQHFCEDDAPKINLTEETESKTALYIPAFAPLDSLLLGTDTPPPNHFPVKLIGLTAKPSTDYAFTVTNRAILTSLDSFNPFHNLLMQYRRLFSALASFSPNSPESGGMTNCTFVLWRGRPGDSDYGAFEGFDWSFFSSLCRGGVVQLSPRTQPVFFASIIVGATPGEWDMNLGPKKRVVGVNFAGVTMAHWLRNHLGAHDGANVEGALLAIRRGRREMVNEAEVRNALAAAIAPASLDVVNFDRANYTSTVKTLSRRAALIGVHGAALCNLIFLPPGSAVVEITISEVKTEFYFLAHSFGKIYFEHSSSVPMDEHLPDLRDRRINVSDIPGLSRLAARAVSLVLSRVPSCC
jgi:hypothetical protein